jgi:hypothetical protein
MAAPKFSRKVENLIAAFRGLPRNRSRARERETRAGGELVYEILDKYRVGMATPEDAVREAWVSIVGEPNAAYCQPLRIERGRVLVVGVSNPVVRQEMLFHRDVVLKRVRAIPACRQITSIVLRGA